MGLAPIAAAQPTVYVSPAAYAVAEVGDTFTLDVQIADYEDLRGFSIEVLYNQAALQHTSIAQGDVFTLGGGPGGILLSSGSNPTQGIILADGARIGGGGSTGAEARLFRISFEAIGPGATDIFFGQILLRDSANEAIAFETADGVVAVVSPLPDASFTRIYDPQNSDATYVTMGATGTEVRVTAAGSAPRAKLTAARYDQEPPGGSTAPFTDHDGTLVHLGLAASYWEITSSLADAFNVDLGFSYADFSGPEHPSEYRVARRDLGAQAGDEWTILPAAVTHLDQTAQTIRIEGPERTYGSGQYALAFDAKVSDEPGAMPQPSMLHGPYPNPFSEQITFSYSLSRSAAVRLAVYDLLGRRMALLVDEPREAGAHAVIWTPAGVGGGVYVVVLQAGADVEARRVVRMP